MMVYLKVLDAKARPPRTAQERWYRHLKKRKFCPVTGLEGLYTDPKSGIPYANLKALEQIRERQPPWILQGSSGGVASYFEAVKSLRNEDWFSTYDIRVVGVDEGGGIVARDTYHISVAK